MCKSLAGTHSFSLFYCHCCNTWYCVHSSLLLLLERLALCPLADDARARHGEPSGGGDRAAAAGGQGDLHQERKKVHQRVRRITAAARRMTGRSSCSEARTATRFSVSAARSVAAAAVRSGVRGVRAC
jgi:hypothetical protein